MGELEQRVQLDGRLEFPLGLVEALGLQCVLAGAQVLHRTLLVRALCLNRRRANDRADQRRQREPGSASG